MTKFEAVQAAEAGKEVVTKYGDTGVIAQVKKVGGVYRLCLEEDQHSWYPVSDCELV